MWQGSLFGVSDELRQVLSQDMSDHRASLGAQC